MKKGMFIALEGIDYAGKDSQALKLVEWLKKMGHQVGFSNEPNDNALNGSPLGHTIRKMLKGEMEKPEPFEFQRMYLLDRGQDIFCFIKPVIDKGGVYVIIRYGFSTIAYGTLSGKPAEAFIQLHREVLGTSLIWPDMTFLIDISGKESARRMATAKNNPEFFEKKDKLEKVRQAYLTLAKNPEFNNSIYVVNGEQNEDKVFEDIKKIVFYKLPPIITK